MTYTTRPDQVDAPDWAAEFDVGDGITVEAGWMDDGPVELTVIGWSTVDRNEGLPVVLDVEIEDKTGQNVPENSACNTAIPKKCVVEGEDA